MDVRDILSSLPGDTVMLLEEIKAVKELPKIKAVKAIRTATVRHGGGDCGLRVAMAIYYLLKGE